MFRTGLPSVTALRYSGECESGVVVRPSVQIFDRDVDLKALGECRHLQMLALLAHRLHFSLAKLWPRESPEEDDRQTRHGGVIIVSHVDKGEIAIRVCLEMS
jgi:hypothetical protein